MHCFMKTSLFSVYFNQFTCNKKIYFLILSNSIQKCTYCVSSISLRPGQTMQRSNLTTYPCLANKLRTSNEIKNKDSPVEGTKLDTQSHCSEEYKVHPVKDVDKRGFLKKIQDLNMAFLKRYFPAMHKLMSNAGSDFLKFKDDAGLYIKVMQGLKFGNTISSFSHNEIQVYSQLPSDMKKLSAVIIVAILPFGPYFIFPLAYLYPKTFLTEHFWNDENKYKFWREESLVRFAFIEDACKYLTEYPNEEMTNAMSLINQGHCLSVDQISEILPVFEKEIQETVLNDAIIVNLAKIYKSRKKLVEEDTSMYNAIDKAMLKEGIEHLTEMNVSKYCFLRCLDATNCDNQERIKYLHDWCQISKLANSSNYSCLLFLPVFLSWNHPANAKFRQKIQKL